MTSRTAAAVADAVLITAGLAAAYLVITRPPLRRLAFRVIRTWITLGAPLNLVREAKAPAVG